MIKQIKIKNFESHIDTVLDLHPGVNILTGRSDHGKSSIIRAEVLLAKNRPNGGEYTPNDDPESTTCIENIFEDGSWVKRIRKKGKNSYVTSESKSPLKAVKTEVPEEVRKITRLFDVNIRSQHPNDQYFLLTDSPGKVSKKLNEVAGLSIMDKVISSINSMIRENDSELRVLNKSLEESEEKSKELSWCVQARNEINSLLKRMDKLKKKKKKVIKTENIIYEIENLSFDKFKDLDRALKAVNDLISREEKIDKNKQELKEIKNLCDNLTEVNSELSEYNHIEQAIKALKTLINKKQEVKDLEQLVFQIEEKIEDIESLSKDQDILDSEIDQKEREFEKKLKKEGCPLCERKYET